MRVLCLIGGIIFSLFAYASEDDWLGDDQYGGSLGFRVGAYEDDTKNYSFNGTLPLFMHSQLHMVYSEFHADYSDAQDKSEQLGVYWNSDPIMKMSFGFGYEESGKGSNVVSTDLHAYLQYTTDSLWSFRLNALSGEVDLNVIGVSRGVEQQFRNLGLLNRDRTGWGGGISYNALYWGVNLNFNVYDYGDDAFENVSESESLTQLLQEESIEEARFWIEVYYAALFQYRREQGDSEEQAITNVNLFFTLNAERIRQGVADFIDERTRQKRSENQFYYRFAYSQQSLLSNQDVSLDAYWENGNTTYSTGVLYYESYIDEDSTTQVYGAVGFQLTDQYHLGLLMSYSDDSGDTYGEVSMGFDW